MVFHLESFLLLTFLNQDLFTNSHSHMQTEFLSIDSYSFTCILVGLPTALCVLMQGGLINVQQLITSLLIIMQHVH